MKNIDNCVICGSKNVKKYDAECSPFLEKRIWNSKISGVKLLHCNTCDFLFYNPRLDDEEVCKLYENYRGIEYQKQRQEFELIYTEEFNNSLGNKLDEIEARKRNLSLLLSDRIDFKSIKNVLDYGGDKGQFIIDEFDGSEKYVYDISNIPLNPNIKRISNLNESETKKFDFIMCCHVLEHSPNPHDIINNLKKFSHKNTKFYFELPLDSPLVTVNWIIKFFMAHPHIYHYYSKIRHRRVVNFFTMHEHINHFSIQSLTKLIELHKLNVEYIGIREVNLTTSNKLLSCFATKNEPECVIGEI
jgi:hypothetical protein